MEITVQINNEDPVTLTSAGFTGGVLTSRLDASDELTLIGPFSVDAAPLIAPFAKVILRADSVIQFIGWLDRPNRAATESREAQVFSLSSAWRWLQGITFKAKAKIATVVTPEASASYTLGGDFNETDEPVHVTVREQLFTVLQYAKVQSDYAFDFDLPAGFGNIEIPWESRNDDKCADVVIALLAYLPTAVIWWSYPDPEGGDGDLDTVPVLNFADRADAAAAHTLTEASLMRVPQLTPRYDLLRSTVRLNYQSVDGTQTIQTASAAGDAAALSAPFGIEYTFTLQSGEPVPATGLAQRLAKWHQKLHIETLANFTGGLNFDRLPGEMWTFGGVFSAFSSYSSLAQQISRDLFFERETVTLGIPAAPSTFRLSKRVRASNKNEPEQTPSGEASGGGSNGAGSGGQPGGGGDPQTGTLTIAITAPTDAPDFDAAECPWVAVGPKTYTGKGAGGVTVEVGNYAVQFLPVWQVTTGLTYISESNPSVTITAGGGDTATGSYDTVQRVFARANGQENETGIDINAQDIVDLAPPTGNAGNFLLKVREVDCFIDGDFQKQLAVVSEPYLRES